MAETPASPETAKRGAAIITGVMIAAAIILSVMGQAPWCSCGGWRPGSWDVWSKHNSQHLLDPYTFTHILHGIGFFAILYFALGRYFKVPTVWRAVIAAVLESSWEILENSPMVINRYRQTTISLDYFGDSVANSLGDVAACMFGFWLAFKLPWKVSLALFVVTELTLLYFVKDSLLLNILQLVYPLESVKQWQMGTTPTS